MVDNDDEQTGFWSCDGELFPFELEIDYGNSIIEQNGDAIIVKRVKSNGHNCIGCKEFYQYAEANQKDGTFKCWGCRH